MTKFIVFDRPEDTEPVVRLKLVPYGTGVSLIVVNERGIGLKTLLDIDSNGVARATGATTPGLPFDERGRIKLRD